MGKLIVQQQTSAGDWVEIDADDDAEEILGFWDAWTLGHPGVRIIDHKGNVVRVGERPPLRPEEQPGEGGM